MLSADDLTFFKKTLLHFFKEAGPIAAQNQDKVTPQLKADNSVLTEVDLKISALTAEVFAPLKEKGHFILDEETFSREKGTQTPIEEIFKKHDILWAIDPIDGTSSYAAGLPSYAISAGALYKGKPLMGGVYMPAIRELFFFDGLTPTLTLNAFTPEEATRTAHIAPKFNKHLFFDLVSGKPLFTYDLQHLPCYLYVSGAMAVGLANVGAGRFNGSYFRANLWDMAGAWPLLQAVGAKLINLHTGEPLEEITPDVFIKNQWYFKDAYLACNPSFFTTLKEIFKLKRT